MRECPRTSCYLPFSRKWVFCVVLGNKCFPLDPVLKEYLGFLPLVGVTGDCLMAGVTGVCGTLETAFFYTLLNLGNISHELLQQSHG